MYPYSMLGEVIAMSNIRNILLVEDSPGDARLTKEAFKDGVLSTNIYVVEDGSEALSFLRNEGIYHDAPRPDLILLDLNLPKIDGRQVLTEVKNDPLLQSIPIIVLSTSQSPSDISFCYRSHGNCFISKPVEIDRFSDIVHLIESFWLNAVCLPDKR